MRALTEVEKQWIFAPEALQKTATLVEGYTSERELQKRRRTILSIRSLAFRTGLCDYRDPNARGARGVMTVAATLVHRFYMRRAFQDFSEELMAGTMLFLASKIEEEPLKLRYICNACLSKFDNDVDGVLAWKPAGDDGPPPSQAYRKWEKEILAAEEIVLETLCFDMGIEQPWVVLRRSIRGLDALPIDDITAGSRDQGEARAQRGPTINEAVVSELGWAFLNEAHLSPICVLHPAGVLAFATFVVVISTIERLPLSDAMLHAAELSGRFGLDVDLDEQSGTASGSDLPEVKRCLAEFLDYCRMGLIDPDLVAYIPEEPTEPRNRPYIRRYRQEPAPAQAKGFAVEAAAAAAVVDQPVDVTSGVATEQESSATRS